MKLRLALLSLVLGLAAAPLAVSAVVPFRAVLKAPATDPQVDVDWWYSIKATDLRGRPVAATLTAVVVDPFGGVHPIDYGPSEPPKPIVNRPFRGTFKDFVTFPRESRNFTLTLRWTVKTKVAGKTYKRVLTRKVKPQ